MTFEQDVTFNEPLKVNCFEFEIWYQVLKIKKMEKICKVGKKICCLAWRSLYIKKISFIRFFSFCINVVNSKKINRFYFKISRNNSQAQEIVNIE